MNRLPKIPPMLNEVIHITLRKAFTRRYPQTKVVLPTEFRGKQIFDATLCISCGLCARDCPAKAIEMVEFRGKKNPLFHLDHCVFCYQCAESCARSAIKASLIFEMANSDKKRLVTPAQLENGKLQT